MPAIRLISSFDSLVDLIEASAPRDRVFILGICGFSNAGKTTLCRRILGAFADAACHFDCDKFSTFSYPERQARLETAARSGDPASLAAEENPLNWYDWDAIQTALDELRSKRGFSYDKAWNKRTGMLDETYTVSLPAAGPALVLCDGIYLLHSRVRRWFDAAMLLDVSFSVAVDRERMRARNAAMASYMERLHRTYSQPYFEEHALDADWVYAGPQTD